MDGAVHGPAQDLTLCLYQIQAVAQQQASHREETANLLMLNRDCDFHYMSPSPTVIHLQLKCL